MKIINITELKVNQQRQQKENKQQQQYISDQQTMQVLNNSIPVDQQLTSLKDIKGGNNKQYKEILGKRRRIYKIKGYRKEHVKYKGELIPVSDYKKLFKKIG